MVFNLCFRDSRHCNVLELVGCSLGRYRKWYQSNVFCFQLLNNLKVRIPQNVLFAHENFALCMRICLTCSTFSFEKSWFCWKNIFKIEFCKVIWKAVWNLFSLLLETVFKKNGWHFSQCMQRFWLKLFRFWNELTVQKKFATMTRFNRNCCFSSFQFSMLRFKNKVWQGLE